VAVRAFLFDFDGLLVDTETAAHAAWELLFRDHGHELPRDRWALGVGTIDGWDIWAHLEELTGRPLDREALNAQRVEHELSLLELEGLLPGIAEYLEASTRLGIRRAIVSSSSRSWIDRHLARLERTLGWDAIVTADFDRERAKPSPTLYLEALEVLGVKASEAVAFEDSPNGVRAATGAGIFTVAVPNAITRDLGLDEADLVVDSLADLPPEQLLARVVRGG
jgi:HAD superfamily hydrolase (TIGR01509 family)